MAKRLTYEEEMERVALMYTRERELYADGRRFVAGVDEAGRGPLAGPVYAAAVVLKENDFIEGINDSKKLSKKKREELFDIICQRAEAYCICAADERRIDEINILNATFEAMAGAVNGLKPAADYVIIDGNQARGITVPHETMVKGDAKSASVAAASILAKVSRDRYMEKMAELYPEYGFERHSGYGTKEHREAILKYGVCPIHRRSFLKKILAKAEDK